MSQGKNSEPPRWAERLLEWYCKPELLEDLQGDLNEYFERNIKSKGVRRAKFIFVIDVFKFFRLYTIRKPEFVNLLINWIMLGSYIKTSGRNIRRNPLFSTINIVGLSISMSVGLVMIVILSDIFSYDKFHEKHERIYRVISQYQFTGNKNPFAATTSLKAGKMIKETSAAIEEVAILQRGFEGDLKVDEKTIPLSGFWANPSLFKVFSFELLQGNPTVALKEPYSIVLTEKSAKKLFGSEEALGKSVVFSDKLYTITGILKDVPTFSHIKFDMLGSSSTREIITKGDKNEMAWDNMWGTWVYLLLQPDANLKNLKAGLDQLSEKEDLSVKNTHIELALQPLDNIMFRQDIGNEIGPVLGSSTLWIFGVLSFVVMLSAVFNYTNLSIARSLRRSREVGIRKVIGALKSHVAGQFVVEAVIISLCALMLAFLLFIFLRASFLSLQPGIEKLFALKLTSTVVIYFIVFAIIVGIAAGIFPAIFFSRIKTVQVLKNLSAARGFKKLTMRKALVVFQYSLSIIFITFTTIVYKQYKHFVAFDLGFKTENILNINLQRNKAEILRKELGELPDVKGISQSMIVTGLGNEQEIYVKYRTDPDDSAAVFYNSVDENYMPLHEHQLLTGRNFTSKSDSAETEVIVNRHILKRFNIAEQNPAKALNEIIKVDGKDLRIVGVMKDFHYWTAGDRARLKEVVFRCSAKNAQWLNVKIQSYHLLATYTKIESIWKRYDTVHPFDAKFYDDQIAESFAGMRAMIKIVGFLAFLSICIASMGLLGMVVFTTETRLKEISIRKVMGASEAHLMFLLGHGFFLLLAIASAIALPITYLFCDRIYFPILNNHAPISTGDLVFGVSLILLVALVMIVSQTLKVARTNPAEVLKTE